MKKFILMTLTIALALLPLTACGGGDEPPKEDAPAALNVCVDLRRVGGTAVSDMLLSVPGSGKEFTLLMETIPAEGSERENSMQRVRTEILAGKGPDIFLCDAAQLLYDDGVLFPFPRQVMESRIFLPLDDYIEKAQYMEWDKLLPKIMDAGKNADGQQLLPLGYEFQMYVMEKSQGEPTFGHPLSGELTGQMALYNVLGELADYDNDRLALSEEELLENCLEQLDRFKSAKELPVKFAYISEGAFTTMGENRPEPLDLKDTEHWMLSGPNISGGITANITCFAGINRNTKHPAEAFRVLDFLLSEELLTRSPIYNLALPVHSQLGTEDHPWHGRYMSQGNFEEFLGLIDKIDVVKFYTPLDDLVYDAWDLNAGEDELKELCHKAYVKMNMYLAES